MKRIIFGLYFIAASAIAANAPVLEHLYVPNGFDQNDVAEVVVTGYLPTPCYKPVNSRFKIQGDKIYIELTGNNIEVSALKKAERDKNIILRLFNPSQKLSENNRLKINFPHNSVSITNLKETAFLGNLKISDNSYILPGLKNAEILTLKITI